MTEARGEDQDSFLARRSGPGETETPSARKYDVGVPPKAAEAPAAPSAPGEAAATIAPTTLVGRAKVAVFVTHGMGQPIPFQTLDSIAEELRKCDEVRSRRLHRSATARPAPNPISRAIKFEDQWLQRVELQLGQEERRIEAHVYEAYWAPLTEGAITVKQVIGFLGGAGRNGLRNWSGQFHRWMFGHYDKFPIPLRTVLFLLVSLATVTALVVMNAAIVLVAAGRGLLATKPVWLSDGLFEDLTTTFDIVVTAMAVFALFLVAAKLTRGWKMRAFRWIRAGLTVASFVITIFVIVVAGLAIPLLFFGHVRGVPAEGQFWFYFWSKSGVTHFGSVFDNVVWWVSVLAGLAIAILWAERIVAGFVRDMIKGNAPALTAISTLLVALLSAALISLAVRFNHLVQASAREGIGALHHALAWPLLVAFSAYARLVLVQYVGDVAIYVMPYKLDAFNDLRKQIKALVYKVARAVYGLRSEPNGPLEYSRVIVVGHSLGSVIAYDALNMLILEDAATEKSLRIIERTPLFLTFGSPLDKTAYIFAVQGKGTSEARESVAAAVQPMIKDYEHRPARWVNVFSRWDIISGSLDFYDYPMAKGKETAAARLQNSKRVENKPDPDASTLLIAHTEYWKDDTVVREIYDAVLGD